MASARLMITWIFLLFVISSCRQDIDGGSLEKAFDMNRFVDDQTTWLSKHRYGLRKITRLDSSVETIEYIPDSSGWARELDILRTVDISKPAIRPFYDHKVSEADQFKIDRFIVKDSGRHKTTYQAIYRKKNDSNPSIIRSGQYISNPIYRSERIIEIIFKDTVTDTLEIDSVKVQGYQKIIFRDTAFYNTSTIILPG